LIINFFNKLAMSDLDKVASRKKFLSWGTTVLGTALLGKVIPERQKEESATVKMLTKDGNLVEISREVLDQVTKNKKASNQEIYEWMNNPSKERNT
jgi:hypothetical protein